MFKKMLVLMIGVAYVNAFDLGSVFSKVANSSVAQGLENQAVNVGMSGVQGLANGQGFSGAESDMEDDAENDEQNDIGQAQGFAQNAVNNPQQFNNAF